MSLSKNELAAIYRACEAAESGNIYDYFKFVSKPCLWNQLLSFYVGGSLSNWRGFELEDNNELVLALLFYATIMQEGGL